MRPIEEPTTRQDGNRGTVTTHQAFRQISASRVQGHMPLQLEDHGEDQQEPRRD